MTGIAGAYGALIATHFGGSRGGFRSFARVAALFSDPWLLLAGWIHYFAFDLFIGSWEVRDAQRIGLPHWAVVPLLLLAFMLGPLGPLVYFAGRRRLRVDESKSLEGAAPAL